MVKDHQYDLDLDLEDWEADQAYFERGGKIPRLVHLMVKPLDIPRRGHSFARIRRNAFSSPRRTAGRYGPEPVSTVSITSGTSI